MSRKKYPKRVRFFLAEDIRSDGTKPLILGLFADDTILVVLPPDQAGPTKENPVVLQSLAVLVSFLDCSGSFIAETSLYTPDGSALFENTKIEGGISTKNKEAADNKNINFIAKFVPFSVPEFGVYKLVITLDKKEFAFEFSVLRRS